MLHDGSIEESDMVRYYCCNVQSFHGTKKYDETVPDVSWYILRMANSDDKPIVVSCQISAVQQA